MKSILKLSFMSLSLICLSFGLTAQMASLIRTDGIYIYDNGIEDVISNNEVTNAAYSQCFQVQHSNFDPCGNTGIMLVDCKQSAFLSGLMFFSDSTGRTITIGSCRSEERIRQKAIISLMNEATNFPLNGMNNIVLTDLKLHPDSTISFLDSLRTSIREYYTGKFYGNTASFQLKRNVANCETTYIENRKYIFYEYSEIFDCDWIYQFAGKKK